MKKHLIIHGFALAHVLTTLVFGLLGWSDDTALTLLSILMVFAICFFYRRSCAEAGLLALAYVLADYFLGTQGAELLDAWTPNIPRVYAGMVMTFGITELNGWTTYLVVRRKQPMFRRPGWHDWLLAMALFLTVLLYRIIMIDTYKGNPALLLPTLAFVFLLTILFSRSELKEQLRQSDDKRMKAQYQYHRLKQQLNPHFLFNSLNILDYIVQAGEKDRASAFIHRLAGIYRYQLSMSEVRLVPIQEELRHVGFYVDLLRERFGDAFQVEMRVPEAVGELEVVPCSVQLMVENAQKHNVVSQQRPLRTEIYVEGSYLCVRNNLQLRRSRPDSTGVGLQNIRMQYSTITSQPVEVQNDGKSFTVRLPII